MRKKSIATLGIVVAVLAGLLFVTSGNAEAGKGKKKKADGVEALFKKLDKDNDGKLSKSEFANITAERKKKAAAAANADDAKKGKKAKKAKKGNKTDKRFEALDSNKDGFLSLDEFKNLKGAKKKKDK